MQPYDNFYSCERKLPMSSTLKNSLRTLSERPQHAVVLKGGRPLIDTVLFVIADIPQLPPKTPAKPGSLLDGNTGHISNGLPAPLQPVQLATVEMRKPGSEKDYVPQNYINVDIGKLVWYIVIIITRHSFQMSQLVPVENLRAN